MSLYRPKGSQYWWCRFQIAGREVRRSTRTTDRREAQKRERALRAEIEAQGPKKKARVSGTLADLAGLDVERAIAQGADEKTRVPTLMHMWGWVIKVMGDIEPGRIDGSLLHQYAVQRRKMGVGSSTIRRELQCVKRGLQIAKRRGWVLVVPDDWPRLQGSGPTGKSTGKFHEPAVIAKWLAAINTPVVRDEAVFVLLTGLRSSEVKKVRPDWVEPAPIGSPVPALLRVPAEAAKNRKERVVGLPRQAIDILDCYAKDPHEPVFPEANFKKSRWAAAKRIGYHRTITLRDLRHTHATLAAQALGDAAGVQAALGHSSLSTTQRYLSATLVRAAGASAAVAGLLKEGT